MRVQAALCAVAVCLSVVRVAVAQDAVKVDPKHYSVISENDQVRVLKAHYGPHEKSVMHSHPNAVVVYLTDGTVKMTTPDGKTSESTKKAGSAMYTPAGTHLPENLGDKETDVIVVELKK
jgi:mannose-6-phosphate isomerase-like protein (cupin superfamily)